MNIKQMKETISKFRAADVSVIKDDALRVKAQKLQAKQGGFTLLELLVVVAILAILAGSVISALSGQEEGAAQAVTVHTMATLEDGFGIYKATEKRTLPGDMDSLLCSTAVDASGTAPTITTISAGTTTKLGGTSNVAKVGGGMTKDLADNITVLNVTSGAMQAVVDAGVTSLRYVEAEFCNGTANSLGATEDGSPVELTDVSKPNLIFNDPIVEDGDWEFGAGRSLDLSSYGTSGNTGNIPLAILEEVEEITGSEEDVVAVFGIGPSSDMIGEIVRRAPFDGNAGPDKYSNFSVAVKIATCPAGNSIEEDSASGCAPSTWTSVEPEVVAILDAGGDSYYDEVAEAAGNEEE
jgi:prepilin-type N-terminal cleavage/methylation domain-containing protein